MMHRFAIVTVLIVATLTANGVADPAEYAPPNIVHAIWLQTQGVLASEAIVEPCNGDGAKDAVSRLTAAAENSDVLTLSTEQGGFATGFARCALAATNFTEFSNFAGMTIQSGVWNLNGQLRLGQTLAILRPKADQYLAIATWLLAQSDVQPTAKRVAKQAIANLLNMGLITASAARVASTASATPPVVASPKSATLSASTKGALDAIRREYAKGSVRRGKEMVYSMIQSGDTILAAVGNGDSGSMWVLKRRYGVWEFVAGTGGAIDARHAARYGLTPQDVATFSGIPNGIIASDQTTASIRATPSSVHVLISNDAPFILQAGP